MHRVEVASCVVADTRSSSCAQPMRFGKRWAVDPAPGGVCSPRGGLLVRGRSRRFHLRPQLRVGRQQAAEPDAIQARPWNCGLRRQPLHELQRAQHCRPRPRGAPAPRLTQTVHRTVCAPPQHQMRRAVAARRLELQRDLPGGVEPHPFVRQRGAGDAASPLLQPLAVVRFHPHRGTQAEPVGAGAQRPARCALARHRTPHGQHLLPGARAEGDAARDGHLLQRPQRARLLAVGIRLGQAGLAHLLDQHAPTREHLHAPGNDGVQQVHRARRRSAHPPR